MLGPGTSEAAVIGTLDTGNLLEYRSTTREGQRAITVDSPYMLRSSRCTLRFSGDNTVQRNHYRQPFDLAKTSAWMGGLLLLGAALFQLLLAAGYPYRKIVRKKRNELFSAKLLLAGTFTTALLCGGALMLFEKARITSFLQAPALSTYSVWTMAALFGVIAFWEPRSQSRTLTRFRRAAGLLLCCLCIIVAMEG